MVNGLFEISVGGCKDSNLIDSIIDSKGEGVFCGQYLDASNIDSFKYIDSHRYDVLLFAGTILSFYFLIS